MKNHNIALGLTIFLMAAVSCTKDTTPQAPAEITFGYNLDKISHNTAQVKIIPSEKSQTFFFDVMSKNTYEDFTPEMLFEKDMDRFRIESEENDVSLESVILGALRCGDTQYTITGLTPDTEYVLYSYALSPNGIHNNIIYDFEFKTEESRIPENESGVKIETEEIGSTVCSIRYIPSDPEMMYVAGIVAQTVLEQYPGENPLTEYIDDYIQKNAEESGSTITEVIQMSQNCGEMTSEYHYLVPEGEYLAFAAQFDESGKITSSSDLQFTMGERENIDFTMSYDISEITQTSFKVSVSVSDPEQEYFVECWPTSVISECTSDEEIMQMVIDKYGPENVELHKGNIKNSTIRSLPMNTEYVMIGFGYKETFVTDLFMEEIKTLAQVSPEDLKIEIRIDSKNSIQANAVFLPEDGTVPFHFYFFTEQFLQECTDLNDAVQKSFDINVDQWQTVYPELSREEIIAQISRKGDRSYIADYLVPETTYYMWAATFTDDGKLVSKEPSYATFTTDKYPLKKEIYTEAISTKYFDGDVLSKEYEYHLYYGFLVAVVDTVKVSGAKTWYTSFFKGDVSSESEYPEHQLASNLLLKGNRNKGHEPYDALMKEWGKWTLCSMGVDEEGNYGPIQRTVFDFTREGANNPEEFFDYPNHAPEAPKGKFVEKAAVMRELE